MNVKLLASKDPNSGAFSFRPIFFIDFLKSSIAALSSSNVEKFKST